MGDGYSVSGDELSSSLQEIHRKVDKTHQKVEQTKIKIDDLENTTEKNGECLSQVREILKDHEDVLTVNGEDYINMSSIAKTNKILTRIWWFFVLVASVYFLTSMFPEIAEQVRPFIYKLLPLLG